MRPGHSKEDRKKGDTPYSSMKFNYSKLQEAGVVKPLSEKESKAKIKSAKAMTEHFHKVAGADPTKPQKQQ